MDSSQFLGYFVVATSLLNFGWFYQQQNARISERTRISESSLGVFLYFFNAISTFGVPIAISIIYRWYSGLICFFVGLFLDELLKLIGREFEIGPLFWFVTQMILIFTFILTLIF